MAYRIDLRPAADRQYQRLPVDAEHAVRRALIKLGDDPRHRGIAAVRHWPGIYRARAGDYRILFKIDDRKRVVVVGRVALRGVVYKRMSRLRFD
jgi:mRNA interferase RelE/StbE